jgi:PAS domain-containing protein
MELLARQGADYVERKRDESRLRENELRLTLATEGAGMGWWDIDLRTGKSLWSPSLEQILGVHLAKHLSAVTFKVWRNHHSS